MSLDQWRTFSVDWNCHEHRSCSAIRSNGCDGVSSSSNFIRDEAMCGTSIVRPPPMADGKGGPMVKEKKKEKRRNSDKRKEKSRDAARCRRGKESEIFNEMLSYLPLIEEVASQLDKMSILRLALISLRLKRFLGAAAARTPASSASGDRIRFGANEDALCEDPILELMGGFLMILMDDGESLEPIFVSDGVHTEMGLLPAELLGVSLEGFVHPCDYQELRDAFADLKASGETQQQFKTLQIRMKCTITAKGRVVNIKSAAYKVVKYQLRVLMYADVKYLTAVCEPMGPFMAKLRPTKTAFFNSEVRSGDDFSSQHDLRFVFKNVERLPACLGYSQEELRGESLYNIIHPQDMATLVDNFKELFNKGYCDTGFYRFLASRGGFCWVSTRAQLVQDTYGKPLTVHCVHSVLGDVRQAGDVLAQFQKEARESGCQNNGTFSSATISPVATTDLSTVQQQRGLCVATEHSVAVPAHHHTQIVLVPSISESRHTAASANCCYMQVGRREISCTVPAQMSVPPPTHQSSTAAAAAATSVQRLPPQPASLSTAIHASRLGGVSSGSSGIADSDSRNRSTDSGCSVGANVGGSSSSSDSGPSSNDGGCGGGGGGGGIDSGSSGSHHVLIFAPSSPCRNDGGSLTGPAATCSTSLAPSATGRHISGGPSPLAGGGAPAICPLPMQSLSSAASCAAAGELCSGQASPVAVVGQSKNNQLDNNNSAEQQQQQQPAGCTAAAAPSSSSSLSPSTFLSLVVNSGTTTNSGGHQQQQQQHHHHHHHHRSSSSSYQPQQPVLQQRLEGKQIQQRAGQVTTSVPAASALADARSHQQREPLTTAASSSATTISSTTTAVSSNNSSSSSRSSSTARLLLLLTESPRVNAVPNNTVTSTAGASITAAAEAAGRTADSSGSRHFPGLVVDVEPAAPRTVAELNSSSSANNSARAATVAASADCCDHRRHTASSSSSSSSSTTASSRQARDCSRGGYSNSNRNCNDDLVIVNCFDQQQQNVLAASFNPNNRNLTANRAPLEAAGSAAHLSDGHSSNSNRGLSVQNSAELELCSPLLAPESLEQQAPPPLLPPAHLDAVDCEADCVPDLVSSVDEDICSSCCCNCGNNRNSNNSNRTGNSASNTTANVHGDHHSSCPVLLGDTSGECDVVNSSCVRPGDHSLPSYACRTACDERELTSQAQPPKTGVASFDRALTGIDRFLCQQQYQHQNQHEQEQLQQARRQSLQNEGHHADHRHYQQHQLPSQRYEESDLITASVDCDEEEEDKWRKLLPNLLLAPTPPSVLSSTLSLSPSDIPAATPGVNQSTGGFTGSASAAAAAVVVHDEQIDNNDHHDDDEEHATPVSTSTLSVFAPRTEEMSPGFLQIKGGQVLTCEEPGLDLTHLAPTAGDSAMPLDVEFEINEIPENLFPNLLDSAGCSPLSSSPPYDNPLLGCSDLPPALLDDLSDNLQLETDNLLLPSDWPLHGSSGLDHQLNQTANSQRLLPSTAATTHGQRDHTKVDCIGSARSTTIASVSASAFSRSCTNNNNHSNDDDNSTSGAGSCCSSSVTVSQCVKSAATHMPPSHPQVSSKPMLAALLQSDLVPSSVSQKQRAMVHDWGGTTQPLPRESLSLHQSTNHVHTSSSSSSSSSASTMAGGGLVGGSVGVGVAQSSPKRATPVKFVPQKVQSPLTINSLKRPLSVSQRHHHSASEQSPHRTASFAPLKRRKTLDELQPKPVDKNGSVLMKLLVNGEDLTNGYSCRVLPRQGERGDSKDSGIGLGVVGNGKTELRSAQDFLCSLASQLDHAPGSVGSDASDFCHLLSADDDILMALAAVTQE